MTEMKPPLPHFNPVTGEWEGYLAPPLNARNLHKEETTMTDEEIKKSLNKIMTHPERKYVYELENRVKVLEEKEQMLKLDLASAEMIAEQMRKHIEELETTMSKIRDLAIPPKSPFRTKSKRERMILIANAVDDVIKGTDDDV